MRWSEGKNAPHGKKPNKKPRTENRLEKIMCCASGESAAGPSPYIVARFFPSSSGEH